MISKLNPDLWTLYLERVSEGKRSIVISTDFARIITYFNDTAEECFGYSREEVLGKEIKMLYAPDFDSVQIFENSRERTETHCCLNRRKDGTTFYSLVHAGPVYDSNGAAIGISGSSFELSDSELADTSFQKSFHVVKAKSSDWSEPRNPILGNSQVMSSAIKKVHRLAHSDITVLIEGESGTGKELVAREIHDNSSRRKEPFIALNCAAISTTLVQSDLFGHIKGSFTGAVDERKGCFERAEKGTLFLDEIGDCPLDVQGTLLRVLEEKQFSKVGEIDLRKTDVRVLAATNKNLSDCVRKGTFREDLFYRLSVGKVFIPPLRERATDILQIANFFLATFFQSQGIRIEPLSKEVEEIFLKYSWPGNARELRNVCEELAALSEGSRISIDNLPDFLCDGFQDSAAPQKSSDSTIDFEFLDRKNILREKIADALVETKGNKVRAARLLGISRATLYRHISSGN